MIGDTTPDATTVLLMGLCPAIAVSVRVIDALWMSAGVVSVLLLSTFCMTLIARGTGGADAAGSGSGKPRDRFLAALVLSSLFTASFEILLNAAAPASGASLGIYAPLIAVNCLVLDRARSMESGTAIGRSLADAAGMGAGFAACLLVMAILREVVGAGTITLFPVGGFGGVVALGSLINDPARAAGLAGGGLLCLGYLAALVRRRAAIKDGAR
jgi:Na+-translocating ferredoxin:NAD+ oxidoreductase subunit E